MSLPALFSVSLELPIEPLSVNRMYGRDKRHKSQLYKDWERAVLNVLSATQFQEAFKQFRAFFNTNTHALRVSMDFKFPKNILLNQAGQISSRAEDLSNIEKPLIDILFLPKYHVQPFPYGGQNFNVDDKLILQLASSKSIGPKYSVLVKVDVIEAPSA